MQFIDLDRQYRRIRADVDARIARVLEHGHYILGPEIDELEQRLAAYVGVRHAIAVASGTDALVIALLALGIGPGDEVITTPLTFAATAEAVALVGARAVFADIDPVTYNLDPRAVEAQISARTRAILPVDLYGQCADYAAIERIAQRHALAVIADGAQSFGATCGGRRAGSFGTVAATSFYPAKPLGTYGDGGALFTHDDALAAAMRQIRVHGQDATGTHVRVGLTGRLDTIKAAVLLAKLEIFDDELAARARVAQTYDALLGGALATPVLRPQHTSAWAQYTVRVERRDAVRKALTAAGIPVRVYYPVPLHRQPAYANDRIELPIAERVAAQVLSLPMHPYLERAEQESVAHHLIDALRQLGP